MKRMWSVLGYGDIDYLCCDMDEFIEHIEEQFDENMNWGQYGITFELDHIKPLGEQGISVDEIINRLCYLNVRPLSISENRSKVKNEYL